MAAGGDFPFLIPPDPGGGTSTTIDGSYTGARLPSFMDKDGNYGELVVLKVEPVTGKLPENPFMLRMSVEHHIAGMIEGAFPEARGLTYALKVRNKQQIEKLLLMNKLLDGTQVKVTKHTGLNSVRCVINCHGMEKMTDAECLKYLADQKVTYVRRITRKIGSKIENTGTVILTLDGTTRPEHIDIGYQRCRTRAYYPSPMLCYRCYNFGHTKARCQQTDDTCGNCGKHHSIADGERCPEPAYCPKCKSSDHAASSRKCPVYIYEDAIQHIRVDKGLSYPAAKRLFDASTGKGSFANITTASKDKTIKDLSSKVESLEKSYSTLLEQMKKQIADKDREIEELRSNHKTNGTGNNNPELNELRRMFVELQAEVRQKDERIKALEASKEPSNRLDLTRKNGTIEDLVKRVQSLEDATAAKDRENEVLRAENKALREQFEKLSSLPQPNIAPNNAALTRKATENKPQRPRKLALSKQPTTVTQINPEQPKESLPAASHTGAIKKVASQQSSSETDPKRTKPGSPLRISDSDEEMVQELSDVSLFSNEEGDDQQEQEMEP